MIINSKATIRLIKLFFKLSFKINLRFKIAIKIKISNINRIYKLILKDSNTSISGFLDFRIIYY